jgi:hypothetical protein
MSIALVQATGNISGTASVVKAYTSANVAGNLLVACVVSYAATDTPSISDTLGNTWSLAVNINNAAVFFPCASIFYCANCKAGANTVTGAFQTAFGGQLHLSEYSGAATTSPLDKTATGSGTSANAVTSPAVTTTVNGELLWGWAGANTSVANGAGMTVVATEDGHVSQYAIQATAGSTTMAWVTTGAYLCALATFKPAGGGSAFTKSLTESFTLAESFKKAPARALVESFTLAESFKKAPARALVESFSPSESFNKAPAHALAESFTLTDAGLVRKPQRVWTEPFSLAESLSKSPARALAEAFTLVDTTLAAAKTKFLALADSLSAWSESLSRSTARLLAEAFSPADTFAAVRAKFLALTDAVALAEIIARSTARTVVETALTLGESLARSTAKRLSEALGVGDTFAALSVKVRAFAESFALSESLTRSALKSVSDALALTETLGRLMARRFVEAFGIVEAFAASLVGQLYTLSLSDALTLGENFAAIIGNLLGRYPRKFIAEVLARLWTAAGLLRRVQPAATRLFVATEIMIYTDPKDPESVEDFQIDWSVQAQGDPITTSTWEVPDDLTVVAQNNTTTLATARISGGVAGRQYPVKNLVTCASGQIRAQALLISVAF